MNYRTVAITGASSGIGAALAQRLAAPGRLLVLMARNAERLEHVAETCRAKAATCRKIDIDVRDRDRIVTACEDLDRELGFDLLIANAGILDGRRADEIVESGTTARHVLETNLLATIDVVHAVLPGMRKRRRGSIVLVSSLAGFFPLTDAPAYSASKAALVSYGVALRSALSGQGINVVVACPGFVITPMSDDHVGAHPDAVTADDAARRILAGLDANRALIGFPTVPFWLSRLSLLVPESWRQRDANKTRFHVRPRPPAGT